MQLPFDNYPFGGRALLGKKTDGNCRHEYGKTLMQKTGQVECGYCACSLVDTYEHWLLMCVDHVLPASCCKIIGVPMNWCHDYSNLLLCCLGCNGFKNRWELDINQVALPKQWTDAQLGVFYDLRDAAYLARAPLIESARNAEKAYYASQPWRVPAPIKPQAPFSTEK